MSLSEQEADVRQHLVMSGR